MILLSDQTQRRTINRRSMYCKGSRRQGHQRALRPVHLIQTIRRRWQRQGKHIPPSLHTRLILLCCNSHSTRERLSDGLRLRTRRLFSRLRRRTASVCKLLTRQQRLTLTPVFILRNKKPCLMLMMRSLKENRAGRLSLRGKRSPILCNVAIATPILYQ